MNIMARTYDHDTDFDRVGKFLLETYRTVGDHINWLQPRWEYIHFHPLSKEIDLASIVVWEADGRIVGVAHPEHPMGVAYFEIDPEFGWLRQEMLDRAEASISTQTEGTRCLRVYINDLDHEFQDIVTKRGYSRDGSGEPMSHFPVPDELRIPLLPEGYRLTDLATGNDLGELHRVLWRGFDRGDDPPDDGLELRKFMQSAPNYDRRLNIVAIAPDGHFASYCGMWMDPVNRACYVEPVATDPEHRRKGLASAAVIEGIRRCAERGATVAYVGSTLPMYRSIGFEECYRSSRWVREWRGTSTL